jgi:hypothetical protein
LVRRFKNNTTQNQNGKKMIVTLQHLKSIPVEGRKAGYCVKGTKLLLERYSLDWEEVKRNGIDAQVLLETGDAQAIALVEYAKSLGESNV